MERKVKVEFHGGPIVALVPFVLFIISCILFFVKFQYYEMLALAIGAFLAIIIGSILSKNWGNYWDAVIEGMSSPIINTLALIFIVVGMFAKMMARAGIAEGFVFIGAKLGLSGNIFCAFAFLICCLISMATGTSFGTVFSGFPILYPAGILLGASPVYLAGAILSGAIFGDNLAPISDTTMASASSQSYKKGGHADIGGVVFSRLRYCLTAAAISFAGYLILGGGGSNTGGGEELLEQYSNPKGLIMLLPVIVLLIVAFKSRNIFIAVTWGFIVGIVVGLLSGVLSVQDIIWMEDGTLSGFTVDGVNNMVGTVIFLYGVSGIIGLLSSSGLMDMMVEKLIDSKLANTPMGVELIIYIGVILSNICMGAAAGAAIVMFAPICEKLGQSQDIHPYRRANLLDCCSFTLASVIPATSSFVFVAVSAAQGLYEDYAFIPELNPATLAYSTFHCWALFFVMLFAILTGWGRKFEGPNGEELKEKPSEV